MYYTYLIKSKKNGKLYIGQTNNLRKPLQEYNSGLNSSIKPYAPYEIIYYEAYKAKEDATLRKK